MIKVDYAILGGGTAGLCAARRLIELGASPLVIESGNYPAHKVCGEFFSPSSLKILQKWDIHPIPLYEARLHTLARTFTFSFPSPAGSLSHIAFDPQLAAFIQQQGATLLTNTQVQQLQPASHAHEDHRLLLSSGTTVLAKHLFIAAGRLPFLSASPPRVCYRGFKAHFTGIELKTLEMFSFPGAYLGLVPVEGGRVNLACLVQLKRMNQVPSHEPIMKHLIDSHPHLRQLLKTGHNLFGDWMEAQVPEFGLKSTPHWLKTYFIGDAAGTIPPACGNGLSLALASGYLAAEFAMRDDAPGFKRMWQKCCTSPLFFGKGLHHLFLHPVLGNWGMQVSEWFPFLAKKIFNLTRSHFS